jgi:acyl carrier protein
MTTNEKVCELIIKVKQGKLSQDKLKPEADLRNDLGMDSLDMSELLVLAEEAFNISVDIEKAQQVKTLAEMVAGIDQYRAV